MELDQTNSINRGHEEMKTNDIEAIGQQQREARWKQRQEAAARQESEQQAQRVERYRSQRIAQIKSALAAMPARRKHAEMAAGDAEELASIWTKHIDSQANTYTQRIHGERQSGRPVRLELGSEEAQAYFFGSQIKKSLLQLAATATQRSFGAPLIDAESFAAELRNEEKKLKAELSELEMRG